MWSCGFRVLKVIKDVKIYKLTFWLHSFLHFLAANLWWKALSSVPRDSRIWNSRVLCFVVVPPHHCTDRGENKTKSELARPLEWVRKRSDSAWPLRRADNEWGLLVLNHCDAETEVPYLHPILCTLLLSIQWFMVWVPSLLSVPPFRDFFSFLLWPDFCWWRFSPTVSCLNFFSLVR